MSGKVFVFKVALSGRKNIWRRIAAKDDNSLDDLHAVIFDAFDRYDEHLYSFYFPRPGAKGGTRYRDAVEYSHPEAEAENDASEVTLGELRLQPKQVFRYVFDFGDNWTHDITVEQVDAEPEKGTYPRIIESHGESPKQYSDSDDDEDFEDE